MAKRSRPFRYKTYGEGFPLVIIPGLDGITEFHADNIPEFSRHFKVVVYYLPLLAEAVEAGKEYTLEYIAADLVEVLHELQEEKAHIIGESFGGVVAQVFALNYPDLVEKLVLISSAPHFDVSLKNRILVHIFPIIPQWLFARVHVYDVCEPHDPQWAKDAFIREAAWADHASVVARTRIAVDVDLRDRVKEIKAPTLLVAGGADRFTGEASREMLKMLPHGEVFEIPDGGHLCHMTHPDLYVQAVMNFL